MRCEEAFTRFVYAFVQARRGTDGREGVPVPAVDLEKVDLGGLKRPGRQGPEPVWCKAPPDEVRNLAQRLASPVADYLIGEGYARPLVRVFRWEDNSWQALLRDLQFQVAKTRHRTTYCFDIRDVWLYLFDTGVGLLAFEAVLTRVVEEAREGREASWSQTEVREPLLRDLIEFNSHMKTLRYGAVPEVVSARWLRAVEQARTQGRPLPDAGEDEFLKRLMHGQAFTLKEWIRWSLSPLERQVQDAGGHLWELGSPFLMGLTCARIPPKPQGGAVDYPEVAEDLFRLRRFYGPNYRPSAFMVAEENNPEVYRPFEGVVHGISIEGMATLILDDGRTPFFRELPDRVRSNYFILFILALHQRVALEFLATCSSRFERVSVEEEGLSRSSEVAKAARILRSAAFHFTLHHTFPWVGAITMYQAVYERLCQAMRLRELDEDLQENLRELDELLERIAREAQEEKDRQDMQRSRRIEYAVAFLAPLTLLLAFWGTNFREVSGGQGTTSLRDPWAVVSYLVTALMFLGLLILLRWPNRKKSLPSRQDLRSFKGSQRPKPPRGSSQRD